MVRTLLLILLGLVLTKVEAQLVLEEDWLISAGFDMTLRQDASFRDPEGNTGLSGADRSWNFSGMQQGTSVRLMARNASEGVLSDSFPTADLVFTSTNPIGLIGAGNEIYLRKDNDDLLIIGFADATGLGLLPPIRLRDPITFQSTPLSYRSTGSDQNRLRIPLSSSILGDSTITSITDSIAISLVQDISYLVDGWGRLTVNGREFDALRLSSVTETSQEFEVKVPFLGWISATPFLPDSIPTGSFRAEDVSWVVAEYSYPVVQVALDSVGEANGIQYANDLASSVSTPKQQAVALAISQSGSTLEVQTRSELPGQGELRVYGSDGRELSKSFLGLNGDRVLLDTQQWPSGVSFLSLWQGDRRLLATKRVVVSH